MGTGALGGVVGNILFNFGFVTTVPSWINEKAPNVSVNKSLWSATTICIFIYLAIGIPGAIVYSDVLQGPVSNTCPQQVANPSYNCPNDLMQTLTQSSTAPNVLAQFVNFTSLVFVSFTDFIVPFSLYVELQRRQQDSGREEVQRRISETMSSPAG